MRTEHVRYRILVGGLFAVSATLLLRLTQLPGTFESSQISGASLAVWTALVSIGAPSPLPLGRGSGAVSLMAALDLAALLLFGPAIACWVATLSRLILCTAERWNPLLPGIARLSEAVLATGLAGMAYIRLGGRTGADLSITQDQVLPLAAAAAAYLAVKHGLAFLSGQVRTNPLDRGSLGERFQQGLLGDIIVLPFGALLAWTQALVGPIGIALFLVPLLLARYYFNHWNESRRHLSAVLRTMMSAVDAADPLTWGHSERISRMSLAVGRRLQMPQSELDTLEVAALLHDIGRTAILREILVKPGRLSAHERASLQTHPTIGRDIVSGLHGFGNAAEIVHAHHEQPDGKGYPQGLKGDEVPLGSRIIMVVAAFDAMTSDRPYRRGLAPAAAFEELLSQAGTQFYTDVVEALIQLFSSGKLFSNFTEEQLAQYVEGRGNSRAIAEYLERGDGAAQVPAKVAAVLPLRTNVTQEPSIFELPGPRAEIQALRVAGDDRKHTWLELVGRSHVGRVRKNNEDSLLLQDCSEQGRGGLLVVADGMGGAAAGEVASRIAVDTVETVYGSDRAGDSPLAALERAVHAANRAVHAHAHHANSMNGMGTTCTAVAIVDGRVFVAHVGDSRAYVIESAGIRQLTNDHSLAAEMSAANGTLSMRGKNLLTRSLGALEQVEVDTVAEKSLLKPGSSIFLCSDGLSNLISDEEIRDILTAEAADEACETLIELACGRGAPDNVTVAIARFGEDRSAA